MRHASCPFILHASNATMARTYLSESLVMCRTWTALLPTTHYYPFELPCPDMRMQLAALLVATLAYNC